MERSEVLAKKAREIEAELNTWARSEGIVGAGECLSFSLRVTPTRLSVRRKEYRPGERLKISGQCLAAFRPGTYLRPALLSQDELDEILGRIPKGQATKQFMQLMGSKQNTPHHLFSSSVEHINKALRTPLRSGKFYRIATGGYRHENQLWEVQPPVAVAA